jgi:plastocyanin
MSGDISLQIDYTEVRMKKLKFCFHKRSLAIAIMTVLAFLALLTSCLPEGVSMQFDSGLPAIQSITAQVMVDGAAPPTTAQPTGTPGEVTPGSTVSPTSESGQGEAATPSPTGEAEVSPTPTAAPEPSGTDVMISVEVANFEVVDKLGQEAVDGEGHLHFFLDAVPPVMSGVPAVSAPGTYVALADVTYTWPDVQPGLHIFSVELANNDHTPLAAPVVAAAVIWVPDASMASMPQITSISTQVMEAGEAAPPSPTGTPGGSPSPTTEPMEGAVDIMVSIQSANFEVVDALGAENVPGEGHIHYFLDAVPPTFPSILSVTAPGTYVPTAETSHTWTGVLPGVHLLFVELVNNDHTPLNPPVVAGTLITVMPAGVEPTTTPTPPASPTETATPTATVVPPLTTPPASPSPTGPSNGATTIDLVARNLSFNVDTITVPAGAQVTVNFSNQDPGIPHNFAVYTDSTASDVIFRGNIITGTATTTYTFTAPSEPGTYHFQCDPHAAIMNGDFIVE